MKNYRIFSLVAMALMLALAGGVSSIVSTDGPLPAATQANVADASTATCNPACPAGAASAQAKDCCQGRDCPRTAEECAVLCGIDIETAKACIAACQSGASCNKAATCQTAAACQPSASCSASQRCARAGR